MIPTYKINLDLHPNVRWNNVIDDHKQNLKSVMIEIDNLIDQIAGFYGKTTIVLAGLMIRLYKSTGSMMYLDELKGISKRSDISFNKLVLMQLCYEWCSACTSIGMNIGTQNKTNIHFRTMDWELPALEKLTINLEFYKGGILLYRAVSWVGCVGIMTGMVPKKYTIALNYRRCSNSFQNSIFGVMKLKWPVSYLIRHVLETKDNTKDALETLGTTELVSPCYLTVCSADGKTYVLQREKNKLDKIKVSDKFLIQTNKDDPEDGNKNNNILWSIERNALAKNIVKNSILTQNRTDPEYIFEKFNKHPIINYETIYAVVMDPANDIIVSRLPNKQN